jgi:sensor histidine kinase YesM
MEAARIGKPHIYRCHAGLVNIAVPIVVENQYMGAFISGQIRLPDNEMDRVNYITKHSEWLFEDKEIFDAYERLPKVQYNKVMASAQVMRTMVENIVEKDSSKKMHVELQEVNKKLHREIKAKNGLEKALKASQIKALQLQCNPHFLYNVLNTIGSLALIEAAPRTQELVYLLGDLLRYSVKNNGMTATVDSEVGQIKRYIKMHSIRLGNRFSSELEIDPEIGKCSIPFGMLLPFVENSIIHGLELKESNGYMKLSGYRAEDSIVFDIIDNGVGMSKERLIEVRRFDGSFPLSSISTGIGINNVYHLLSYIYGNKFKLTIESKTGKGTSVRLKIPN